MTGKSWISEAIGGGTYVYTQMTAMASWLITHNLGRFPAVVVVDSGGTVVLGEVTYIDANTILLNFSAPFGGKAYLN
jgi:hypothetical protein